MYSKIIFLIFFYTICFFSTTKLIAQSMEQLEEQFQNANSDSVKAHLKNQMAKIEIESKNYERGLLHAQQGFSSALQANAQTELTTSIIYFAHIYRGKNQFTSSLRWYLQALKNIEKTGNRKLLAETYQEIGEFYQEQEVAGKALEYLTKSNEIYEEMGETVHPKLLSDIAYAHLQIKNYDQSLAYYIAVLEIYNSQNDTEGKLETLRNLTDLYKIKGDYQKALDYNKQVLAIHKSKKDNNGTAVALNNVGFLNKFLGDYDKSLENFKQSLSFNPAKKPNTTTLTNIGVIYQVKGDYTNSLNYFTQALEAAKKNGNADEVAQVYNYLAAIYLLRRDFQNARAYTAEAIKLAKANKNSKVLTKSYRTMSEIYQHQNDYRNAYSYYGQYAVVRDSVSQTEKQELQKSLQRQIAFEKNEKELKLLLIDEEIQDLASKKKQLETDKRLQNLELELQDKKIQETTLQNIHLERQKTQQALLLTQQQLESEKKEQAIKDLEREQELKDLALKQEILEKGKQKEEIKSLELENQLKAEQIATKELAEKEEKLLRYILYGAIALALVIGLIILFAFFQKQKANKLLSEQNVRITKQKDQISTQNQALEEQKQEILSQNEELEQNQEEILSQRDYIEKKNSELEEQAIILVEKNNEVEESYQNLNTLSDIGREITASLHVEDISQTLYEKVNQLMPAEAFGVGIYEAAEKRIKFKGFIEKGSVLPDHFDAVNNKNYFSVQCLGKQETILINNLEKEYPKKYEAAKNIIGGLPKSLIYIPLSVDNYPIGVITVQSFEKNAYDEKKVALLSSLASYTAIAIDNAKAYNTIQNKNRNITDSIRYAQTIQQAVLPSHERMSQYLADYFVLFRPKDIVSGDFYWFSHIDNYTFIATVDCTGHGVPGAFMSMIGHSILNEIVNEKKVFKPSEILEQLNNQVRKALKQERQSKGKNDKANDDGMDVAFCRLEYKENHTEVAFTGAKRPFIYTLPNESNEKEAFYLRGDNKTIGGVRNKLTKKFRTQFIDLPKGAMIYLTTDGYADQNNTKQEKFGTPRLLRFLQEIANLKLSEQKTRMEQTLNLHQRGEEQRDDISMIGIRV
ncbi:serine phosphatase RsbU, regulator of sigma subunit [Bernardetia litoralis DSM 6794]|uniref:Serine phosphatase RsbU, regulator of sigma subunit n=2 Tax=Bernardetia litoralis TaxID=999 RepID=I4AK75_BERLS|nr:serine phosphatase RsbU, regulator of sigma subunit [Bernardetia litoralis DSM 6794]